MTAWELVVEEINRGLPAGARIKVRTARLAWERNRPREKEGS